MVKKGLAGGIKLYGFLSHLFSGSGKKNKIFNKFIKTKDQFFDEAGTDNKAAGRRARHRSGICVPI